MGTLPFNNAGGGAFGTPGVDTPATPQPYVSAGSSPIVSFKLQGVEPPSSQYIAATDRLALTAANSDAAVTAIALTGRQIRADDGRISVFNFLMPIGSNRAVTTQLFDLCEGYLLDVQCSTNPGTQRGRCFAQIRIVRGQLGNFTEYSQLISDYCSRAHNPKWPNGEYIASVESSGVIRAIQGTQPAAGLNINEVVPTGARWRLKAARTNFTTSAAVANRQVRFTIDDGTNIVYAAYAAAVQPAGNVQNYDLAMAGPNPAAISQESNIAGPGEIPLAAGYRIRTAVDNIQAGDQFLPLNYQVEEWIEL